MTTKLVVLAALLTFSCLEAQAAPAKKRQGQRRQKAQRELRVSRAQRVENLATPSIEPQWPAKAELVARR